MTIHDDEDDEEWTGLETSVSDTVLVLWLLDIDKTLFPLKAGQSAVTLRSKCIPCTTTLKTACYLLDTRTHPVEAQS